MVIVTAGYRQGDMVSAYSPIALFPIEAIERQGLDLNRSRIKNVSETMVYSGEYGSACALTPHQHGGIFTAVNTRSHDSAFYSGSGDNLRPGAGRSSG